MDRRLIIDGNAVYELDEKCMLKKGQKEESEHETRDTEDSNILKNEDARHSNAVREEKNQME